MWKVTLWFVACSMLAAQTATVTESTTIGGQPETASVAITLLPKSVISFALPTSGASSTPGGTVSFSVNSSTSRLQPASEQFSISAPSNVVASFTGTAGPVATAASKTMTCAPPNPLIAGVTQVNCVIAAVNTQTMGNGVVANFTATLAPSAPTGSVNITISAVQAANAFTNAITTSITTPTLAITVNPTLALSCAPDTNSVPSAVANQIEPGEQITCTATLSSALSTATTIALSSSVITSPGATVPASISIPAGATSQTFVVTGI